MIAGAKASWTWSHSRQQQSFNWEVAFTAAANMHLISFESETIIDEESDADLTSDDARKQLADELRDEIRQYFETGNCGKRSTSSRYCFINVTFLQLTTGKWLVSDDACPFKGYFPLPVKELEAKASAGNGLTIATHCRAELKKLLVAYRSRIDNVNFFFHPCDALVFCYADSSPIGEFDIIDTSSLADYLGLANVLNAAARKLRTHQSVLYTESLQWTALAPDVVHYVAEVLCCPPSLVPTIYGLRLTGNVQLGRETPLHSESFVAPSYRIRWKKVQPFDGVSLVLSEPLEQSLERLKKFCFLQPFEVDRCGMSCYSPLTFFYVLSDLIIRGRIRDPATMMTSLFSGLPPVFRKSLETIQAWMEGRQVWSVKVAIPLSLFDTQRRTPVLRLILVPTTGFHPGVCSSSTASPLSDLNSAENHFIDNVGLDVKKTADGGIDRVEISFLLEDQSLLTTHSGVVVDKIDDSSVFVIGPFPKRNPQVELFSRPYPWSWQEMSSQPAAPSSGQSLIIAESCRESESDYTIRCKVQSVRKSKAPSGISTKTI